MMRLKFGMRMLGWLAAGLLGPGAAAAQTGSADAAAPGVAVPESGVYRALVPGGRTVVDAAGRLYRVRPLQPLDWRHTLSLEAGFLPAGHDMDGWSFGSLRDDAFPGETRYYQGPLRATGALGLAYGCRVRKWLELGASLSYSGQYRTLLSASGGVVARRSEHCITWMPYVRFAWLNRRVVRLYSGVHLGGQWFGERSYLEDRTSARVRFAGHLTWIGIGLGGRRVFGFAECGYGMRGVLVAGVGYRFGTEQR